MSAETENGSLLFEFVAKSGLDIRNRRAILDGSRDGWDTSTWYGSDVRTTWLSVSCLAICACASEASAPNGIAGGGGSAGSSSPSAGAGGALAGRAGISASGGASAGNANGGSASGASGSSAGGTSGGGTSASAGVGGSGSAAAGMGGAAGSAGTAGGNDAESADAITQLRNYLAITRGQRSPLSEQSFATVPLTKSDAGVAQELLWDDHATLIRSTREMESDEKAITIADKTLRYDFRKFGAAPPSGASLYISLHGGGEADPSVNDEQWENQKILYEPDEGIYLAPRAPTNTWNLWHEAHIDPLLARLIENLIVLEGVDSNRVYVMGYSAGGDGVYQLGPRMADSWAAAAMMAGHPNDAKPDSLRNLGFTIHVGALDTAYDRNLIAGEWGEQLDALEAADPEGYAHEVEVHAGKPHWMDLEDAVAVPWMADFTRNPTPKRVVWLQDDVPHQRFYWLAVPNGEARQGTKVVASVEEQTISLEVTGLENLRVRLSDALVDLDQPVTIRAGETTLFTGSSDRTILNLAETMAERGDPALTFPAEVVVELP